MLISVEFRPKPGFFTPKAVENPKKSVENLEKRQKIFSPEFRGEMEIRDFKEVFEQLPPPTVHKNGG